MTPTKVQPTAAREGLADLTEAIPDIYEVWPVGHKFHDGVPAVLAALAAAMVVDEVEEDDTRSAEEELSTLIQAGRELVEAAYERAGKAGHSHIETIAAMVADLVTVTEG